MLDILDKDEKSIFCRIAANSTKIGTFINIACTHTWSSSNILIYSLSIKVDSEIGRNFGALIPTSQYVVFQNCIFIGKPYEGNHLFT